MIDFGYKVEDGTIHKLEAVRVGRRWAVTQASLDQWAEDCDRQVLRFTTAAIDERGWMQLSLMATEEQRLSLDRLVAAGLLRHEENKCQSSGIVWPTYFRPDPAESRAHVRKPASDDDAPATGAVTPLRSAAHASLSQSGTRPEDSGR